VTLASGAAAMGAALVLLAAPVHIDVQVVHATNGPTHVDAGLEKMRDVFQKSGLRFSSYRRLSQQTVALVVGTPAEVALPDKTATLALVPGEHRRPEVAVSVPPLKTTVSLGSEASAFLQAGPHENGQLVLVLTAVKN
jgi:hypothetical protein